MISDTRPPLLVTLGEPGGVGPELVIKLWLERAAKKVPPFVFLANEHFIKSRAEHFGFSLSTCSWHPDDGPEAVASRFQAALPVFDLNAPLEDKPGQIISSNSPAVIKAIELGVDLVHQSKASAIITNPINKKALYDTGFNYPGHTEFLGYLAQKWSQDPHQPVMMLAGPELRTIPATLHIALKDVPSHLDGTTLENIIRITNLSLRERFGIEKPRIVVTGLNPHAGEDGTMGTEDASIIKPAIEKVRQTGIDANGPYPADTLFHAARRKTYDAAIAMYHDQALLPVKTLAFDETVNVTLGLPFIRTSPDHGTALDIAEEGIARPDSLFAAIKMANEMASHTHRSGR